MSKDQAKCIRNPAKLDYDTQKDQMEIGNEDRFSPTVKMHQKSSKMDSGPQPWMQIKQSSGKTEKEMGRRHQSILQA